MLTHLKDYNGKIIGYIESWQVAQSGYPKERGEYLWVHDLWIHEGLRGKGLIKKLIGKMLLRVPEVKFGYWVREKYNGRKSRLYKREEFKRLLERMEK